MKLKHLYTRGTGNGCFMASVGLLLGLFATPPQAAARNAQVDGPQLTLEGDIKNDAGKNISAIVLNQAKGILVIGADEGAEVQLFRLNGKTGLYKSGSKDCVVLNPAATQGEKDCGSTLGAMEVDVEGLAWGDDWLYAIGSHSRARRSVKDGSDGKKPKTPEKNRERLATIKIEPTREQLFRFKLGADGSVVPGLMQVLSLRDLIANHPVLARFQAIPSKENGIDVEGLAIDHKGRLHFGFRGPVLRGGYALVLRAKLKKDEFELKEKSLKLLHVNLGGRGIRGMSRIDGGFLILAGPIGDGPGSYQVWQWDGKDAVPGKLAAGEDPSVISALKYRCDIPQPSGIPEKPGKRRAKAEGIAALDSDGKRFTIVYDGARRGGLTSYRCPD